MKNFLLKSLLVITFVYLTPFFSIGQCVNFVLTNQSDVDDFPGFCDEPVNIIINVGPDITNFDGLSHITTVSGNLTIYANNPIDLSGFENLTSVGGNLSINMDALQSFNGFNNLEEVGGNFGISNNGSLVSLSGLESLTTVGGGLSIGGNENLVNLNGLNNLTSIQYLSMNFNDKLINLEGLSGLTTVGANFIITANDGLQDLTGLNSLQSIGGHLNIESNVGLACLCGLESLTSIGTEIDIEYNNALLGLTGLENVSTVGGDINITSNNKLSVCNLPNICTLIDQAPAVNISGNATTCNSVSTIQSYCGSTICPEEIALKYQSQINHYSDVFPGCTEIPGELRIDFEHQGNGPAAVVSNLDGLSQLTSIGGRLFLDGLGVQTFITDLSGLENLEYIGGDFFIYYLESLTSLTGPLSLDSIGGYLRFEGADGILNTDGFPELEYIGANLIINGNDQLAKITGFDQLEYIEYSVSINNNPVLESLSGLNDIDWIGGAYIDGNEALTFCAAWPICNLISGPNMDYSFENNAPGCNNETEVIEDCSNVFSEISGKVFIDVNCNGVQDPTEVITPYHMIVNGDDLPLAFTDSSGNYVRLLAPSTTTVISTQGVYGFSPNPGSISIATEPLPQAYPDQNFGLCPDFDFHNLKVELSPYTPPRPGFNNKYQICVTNTGTFDEAATLKFDFSNAPSQDYVEVISASGGTINGNEVMWEVQSIQPFHQICFDIETHISFTAPLGTLLYPGAEVTADAGISEDNILDNISTFDQEVVGSFDPNDKSASRDSISITQADQGVLLEYLIRFQNTGTFPATFIEVLDTLESDFDISSLKMLAASHSYVLSFPEENILKWRFDDINLPDSTSNEPESHGFIKFNIRTNPGLGQMSIIENRAGIYFDFNAPVITNYATTIVALPTSITSPELASLNIFPNPTQSELYLTYSLDKKADCLIQLSDINGSILKSIIKENQAIGDHQESLTLNDLPAGMYFIKVNIDGKFLVRKIIYQP